MKQAFAIAILAVSLSAGSAGAGNFGPNAPHRWGAAAPMAAAAPAAQALASPKVVGYNGTFKLSETSVIGGPCPDGYANQCASGNCECHEFAGSAKGSFGTSSDVTFELTLDLDNQPGDPDGTCFPSFGVLAFDTVLKKVTETQIVDLVGAACGNIDGSSTFTGGFAFDRPSNSLFDGQGPSAFGKFTGASAFQLKLTGKACKGNAACFGAPATPANAQ